MLGSLMGEAVGAEVTNEIAGKLSFSGSSAAIPYLIEYSEKYAPPDEENKYRYMERVLDLDRYSLDDRFKLFNYLIGKDDSNQRRIVSKFLERMEKTKIREALPFLEKAAGREDIDDSIKEKIGRTIEVINTSE